MALGVSKQEDPGVGYAGGKAEVVTLRVEPAPTVFAPTAAFVQIYGATGTGRTTRALQAPGPLYYIHCNEKWEGVVEPVAVHKSIEMTNFGGMLDFKKSNKEIQAQALGIWEAVSQAVVRQATLGKYRTVVLDTETSLYELLRLGSFGKLEKVKARYYGPVNAAWFRFTDALKSAAKGGVNVILVAKEKEKYKGDTGTGVMVAAAQKDTEFNAHVQLRTWFKKGNPGVYGVTVEKPWANGEMKGQKFDGPVSEWGMLMGLITGTGREVWDK